MKIALSAAVAALALMWAMPASAQDRQSKLDEVLARGHLVMGTGSTNAPWHFEDDKGQLTGMDIAIAKILSRGLFDDPTKVEFIKQEPAARIPNITTGKVDIVIQFMTVSPARAQLVNFSRPYYVEGVALLTSVKGKFKTHDELTKAGKDAKASVLQNVDGSTDITFTVSGPVESNVHVQFYANSVMGKPAGEFFIGETSVFLDTSPKTTTFTIGGGGAPAQSEAGVQAFTLLPDNISATVEPGGCCSGHTSEFSAMTAVGRWGAPDELVGPALLLATDAGSYVTGEAIVVDGGFISR